MVKGAVVDVRPFHLPAEELGGLHAELEEFGDLLARLPLATI